MPLDESGLFDPEPHSQADFVRETYRIVREVRTQAILTNGRVSKLEKAIWGIGGGMIVTGAVIVPIFIHLVLS